MEEAKPVDKRQRTKYDAAFRTEAVRRLTQDGQAVTRVALALGMSEAVLGKWVRAARSQAVHPAGNEALEQENKHLRAQLARAEMERDIVRALAPGHRAPPKLTRAPSPPPTSSPPGPRPRRPIKFGSATSPT